MTRPAPRVLIAGVTGRALALSAARAGYQVTAVDAFGDLDLRAAADVLVPEPVHGRFDPDAAARASRRVRAELVAYTSSLENHPVSVARLASGRRLLGNPPGVLAEARDPLALAAVLRRARLHAPATRAGAPAAPAGARWLLKPRRSGGGHGIVPWRRGRAVPRSAYLQERITGVPGSIVFLADGRRATPLALSRQLVGRAAFGARGFRYCGSLIGPEVFEHQAELEVRARTVAETVTREFGLVGLNGVDFIARRGVPWPIEVNPRYCASMELVERAAGVSLFRLHARACAGRLPRSAPSHRDGRVRGKAIVFARRSVLLPDTRAWLGDADIADVPQPGERVARGRPICTVFACGKGADDCLRRLASKADAIYRAVEPRARGAA